MVEFKGTWYTVIVTKCNADGTYDTKQLKSDGKSWTQQNVPASRIKLASSRKHDVINLLLRTLREFVTNTGGGRAGGGGKDALSASLAVSGLLELSFAPITAPTSTGADADTKHMFSLFRDEPAIPDLLTWE